MTEICPCCGEAAAIPLQPRAGWPDALLSLPQAVRDMLGDPYTADTLPSPEDGRAWIRALLTIPLIGKHPEMVYCIWIDADEADVLQAMDVWNDDDAYAKVSMHGHLANAIEPWGLLGAEVTIGVRKPSELPHIESSPDRTLARILTEAQPYETALPVIR
jgi:hypothetical protein